MDGKMAHMDNLTMDSSVANLQNKMAGHASHNPSLHVSVTSGEVGSVEPTSNNYSIQNPMVLQNQKGQTLQGGSLGFGASESMTNTGQHRALLPSKRKADMEVNYVHQHSLILNKRTVQPLASSPHLSRTLQPNFPNNKQMQVQAKEDSSIMRNLHVSNKKMARNESMSSRSGSQRAQTPKGRTAQNGSLSKVQSDSSGAVRSKMREQLAASLVLVSENQDETGSSVNDRDATCSNPRAGTDSGHTIDADKTDDTQGFSAKFPPGEYVGDHVILPDEDASFSDNFFVKDDLLQGNGLSWALDVDMPSTEEKEKVNADKADVDEARGNRTDEGKLSFESLAADIEAELFKLFGGVNKKYKERGRSLLFNLKDPANPELRGRVVSGEITPKRLCSMTAEELASKELTNWRMKKAEEFAHMVVLQDTGVEMRRLVKKTHKGEYEIEMEEKDDFVLDVSGWTSEVTQTQAKSETAETHFPGGEDSKDKGKFSYLSKSSENQDILDSLVIPSDGTDLMQGMIVDEAKDAEFLPPIISLDEFLESLDSEPPFEILQGESAQSVLPPENEMKGTAKTESIDTHKKENIDAVNYLEVSDTVSKDNLHFLGKADEVVNKQSISETLVPQNGVSPTNQNVSPQFHASIVQHVWDGALQLSISSSIKAVGVFRSGEKTSIAEWPSSLEIKGRVRLDAFEKFVKDLPNSRSRAVMVIHFVLKDNSDDSERACLHEAIESYVSDNRLGFAEPAAGVELYLCPTRGRVVDMLSNYYISKDRADIFNSSDNGLIGVIVWRKVVPKTSVVSPKQKSSSKRQAPPRRHQENDANVNVNVSKRAVIAPPASYNRPPMNVVPPPPSVEDDDSDIPPGFGPRDDDDLPEFTFTGNGAHPRPATLKGSTMTLNNNHLARPVDQLRELIHKYGKTGASRDRSLGIEPWNDDEDDDDIPEWQPQPGHNATHAAYSAIQPLQLQRHVLPQQHLNPRASPSSATAGVARWLQQPSGGGGSQYYGSKRRGY